MKVALVHEWLVDKGGSEEVIKDFHHIFPEAPIYVLVYDKKTAPGWTGECDIRTTWFQKIPFAPRLYKNLLFLMPKAWEALDLTEYDLVLSSCSSCNKGIITRPDAVHICYCHSPIRYVWDMYYEYYREAGALKKFFMKRMIPKMKLWDFAAAARVDYFISNSYNIRNRIWKYYRRDADVIYVPCHLAQIEPVETPDDYYLIVSRFVSYKRVDVAIKACNKLGRRLIVVGHGDEEKNLKKVAGNTIEFKGFVSDEELIQYYLHAKAFLFTPNEDFGMTSTEAQSYGVPVLAYGHGGALETVIDGKTGLFFPEQNEDSLADCILRFEKDGVSLSRKQIQASTKYYSLDRFYDEIREYCETKYREHQERCQIVSIEKERLHDISK